MYGLNNSEKELTMDTLLSKNHIHHSFYAITEVVCEDPSVPKADINDIFEIELVIKGKGVHFIEDKFIPCTENDIYIIPPNTPHKYFVNNPDESLLIRKLVFSIGDWFRGDALAKGSKHYCYGAFNDGGSYSYARLNDKMRKAISTLFDSVECELLDKESEWMSAIRSYLIQLFISVGRYVSYSDKEEPRKIQDDETVAEAIKIITEEYGDCELSLDSIAKRVYTGPSKLSRIFKSCTGKLFSEYLREIRYNHAAILLRESDVPIETVISKCGIRDVTVFYKNFRDMFDMTPGKYRQYVSSMFSENNFNKDIQKIKENKIMVILSDISEKLQQGKAKIVKELVQQALDEGAEPEQILKEGLLAGMSVVGEKFKNNEVYVPDVLIAARAMNMGTQILKPHLAANGVQATGKVCIGTVQGDLHDIGKNLVKMMMEGKGLEVIDLGTDVAPETFVQTAIEQNCQVICCSALLTTTMGVMADVVKAAEAAGIRDKVKIMIGGAPVSDTFCKEIGADVYTPDAASAADAAVAFCIA